MTNEELKKKIVEILDNNIRCQPYYYISRGIVYEEDLKDIADALIAAGIGDTTNLIVENEVLQRDVDNLARTLEEGAEELQEVQHRAEVAERACLIATDKIYDYCYEEAIAQAELELAEEEDD